MDKLGKFEVYAHEKLGTIRAALDKASDSAWFAVKDISRCLGINTATAMSWLKDDERKVIVLSGFRSGKRGGARQIRICSESGLSVLIRKSKRKEAAGFRKWIDDEVIPSVRKSINPIKEDTVPVVYEAAREERELNPSVRPTGKEDLSSEVRSELLGMIEDLIKKKIAYRNDANHWFAEYSKLLAEYTAMAEELARLQKRVSNGSSDSGTSPLAKALKIELKLPKENGGGIWTDNQMMIHSIREGHKYAAVEREQA